VIEEAGLRVAEVLFGEQDLFGHVVEEGRLAEGGAVLGEKRGSHVDTIEPHLVRVDVLVPKAALFGAGMTAHLAAQKFESFLVTLLVRRVFRIGVEDEKDLARVDVVDVVRLGMIAGDVAFAVDESIDAALGVVEIAGVARLLRCGDEAFEHETAVVRPLFSIAAGVTIENGVAHAGRPRFGCRLGFLRGRRGAGHTHQKGRRDFGGKALDMAAPRGHVGEVAALVPAEAGVVGDLSALQGPRDDQIVAVAVALLGRFGARDHRTTEVAVRRLQRFPRADGAGGPAAARGNGARSASASRADQAAATSCTRTIATQWRVTRRAREHAARAE
jgi:hypothetical protein